MNVKPIRGAMIAGTLGAFLLWVIQLVMQQSTQSPPLGSAIASKLFGLQGQTAMIIGLILFLLAGAVWGAIYAAVAPRISWLTGLIFGVAPWLVVMLVILPMMGKPVFAGGDMKTILLPLILNCIWGAFTGAFTPNFAASRRTAI